MKYTWLLSTRKHSPLLAEKVARECGYDGVEAVLPWEMDHFYEREYRCLRTAKAVHAPISPAKYGHREFTQSLEKGIRLALTLGARLVNVHPGGTVGNREEVVACIDQLQRFQATKFPGGTVAYEVLPKPNGRKSRHEQQRTYKDPHAWVKDVQQYRLAATIDTTHLASWREDAAEYVEQLNHRVAHVHVSDYLHREQHLFIGEGKIDFGRFFRRLNRLGKEELLISFEPKGRYDISTPEIQEKLRQSLQRLKEAASVEVPTG